MRLLAEARGATVSDKAYEMYATAVSEFPDADVTAVVHRVARRRRGEGEKAWPELGELIEPLEHLANRRREQQWAERERHAELTLFWQVARERIEANGVFRYNHVDYHSLEEVNEKAPRYRGTMPR
jgi:hypothetical protein